MVVILYFILFYIAVWSFHCFVQIIFNKWKSTSHNLETYWETGVETMDIKFLGNSRKFHEAWISFIKLTWIFFTKFNWTTYRYNCQQGKQRLPETSMPYSLQMSLSVAIRNKDNLSFGMLHDCSSSCIIGCLHLFKSCSKESMIFSLTSLRTY